jgi:hypothetical protein
MLSFTAMDPALQINIWYSFVYFGIILVAAGYAETMVQKRITILHIAMSITLPLSFFMVTFGTLELTDNWFYGIACIAISVIWMETRIAVSKTRHEDICSDCGKDCAS